MGESSFFVAPKLSLAIMLIRLMILSTKSRGSCENARLEMWLFSGVTEAFLVPLEDLYRSRGASISAPQLGPSVAMQTLLMAIHQNDSATGSPSRWILSPYMLQKHIGICPPPLSPSWLFFCQALWCLDPGHEQVIGSKTLLQGHQLQFFLGVGRELSGSVYPTDSLRDHQSSLSLLAMALTDPLSCKSSSTQDSPS